MTNRISEKSRIWGDKLKIFKKRNIRNKSQLKSKIRYSIEKEYNRDISPTDFPVENITVVQQYLDRKV